MYSIFVFRGREEDAEKTLLNLRGPQYLMKSELEELKHILASQEDSAEAGFINKLRELKSRAILFPVLMMLIMFSLQVKIHQLFYFSLFQVFLPTFDQNMSMKHKYRII